MNAGRLLIGPEPMVSQQNLFCQQQYPQVREWIDSEDNAQIIFELMLSDQEGEVFNIGTGERYENIEIINMIGEMLGKTPKYEFVQDRLGHDRKYALNSQKVRDLVPEWIPLSFEEYLKEQVSQFKTEKV